MHIAKDRSNSTEAMHTKKTKKDTGKKVQERLNFCAVAKFPAKSNKVSKMVTSKFLHQLYIVNLFRIVDIGG